MSAPRRDSYDPTRYAPVTVAVMQRFPDSSAKAFDIAMALGRLIDAQGSADRLRAGKDAAGSLIKPDRLPKVLGALGNLDARQWRRYVRDWVELYVAHRCARGTVCLFTQPMLEACPACHEEIRYDHIEPPARRNRGRNAQARSGRKTSARPAVERPQSGAGTSADPALERPSTGTRESHPEHGFTGMEVGKEEGSRSELLDQARALEILARRAREKAAALDAEEAS